MQDDNVTQFPVLKPLNGEEAKVTAERLGAEVGVILFYCPCGCGRIKSLEIGEPSTGDLLLFAENLRNFAMDEYIEEVYDDEVPG